MELFCGKGRWLTPCSIIYEEKFFFITHKEYLYEPRHDKTNKMSVAPAKTQISQGIHQVWSESLLCAEWVAKHTKFLHADSEDSD